MNTQTKIEELSSEFSKTLRSWLTNEELEEINTLNETAEYKQHGYCATHEYCDASQAMIDAYINVFGRLNIKDITAMERAWKMSKDAKFLN